MSLVRLYEADFSFYLSGDNQRDKEKNTFAILEKNTTARDKQWQDKPKQINRLVSRVVSYGFSTWLDRPLELINRAVELSREGGQKQYLAILGTKIEILYLRKEWNKALALTEQALSLAPENKDFLKQKQKLCYETE